MHTHPIAKCKTLQPLVSCNHAFMYHKTIPTDMNDITTASINGKNEGAFQISIGMMGEVAKRYSQYANALNTATLDSRTAYSEGFCHPTAGA